ncbi:uncharacterized protein AB9W97_011991 [Spinachia spinachia]
MLNVSCQKQTHCGSLPAGSPTERPMELAGRPRPSGACNLLGVPGLGPLEGDDDDCEVVIGIRPKSSPLPRRRSSDSDDDWEPGPPPSGSRRVSFADAKGLSLVHVKEFDTWNVPKLPEDDSSEGRGSDTEVYFLSPLTFSLPLSAEELFARVRDQKIELEAVELLPGTAVLRGVIRVLNVSFSKAVYIRTTLDAWSSHFDLLAEYVPSSSDGATDRFSFKLAVVPPDGVPGARVDFCLRYETPSGTFWANNNDRNYVLFCHRRVGGRKETPLSERVNNKSCLKTVGRSFSTGGNVAEMEASSTDDGAKVDCQKAEKASNGPSAASEEDRQELLAENRQNCSQRSSRKAARMARVRDYFSQRNAAVDDTERDESPPEENQEAAQEETLQQKHSAVRSLPEGSSKSEGSHFVSEALESRVEPTTDVLRDASPPRGPTSDAEAEKHHIPSFPEEPPAAECQNAEEGDIAARPADCGVPEGGIGSPDSQSSSFSFGTVVAPLYHQVFGRVGNKSTRRTPAHATLHAAGSSYPQTATGQGACTAGTDAEGDEGKIEVIQTRRSNTECLVATCRPLSNDIADHKEPLRDPGDVLHSAQMQTSTPEVPKTVPGDTTVRSHAAHADSPRPRKRAESSQDEGSHHGELPQRPCAQTETALHETRESAAERAGVKASGGRGGDGDLLREADAEEAACETEAHEALHAFDQDHVQDSDTEETEISCVSCLEEVEGKDAAESEMSPEANDVEEGGGATRLSSEREAVGDAEATTDKRTHGYGFVPLKSEDAQDIERHEMDSETEGLCSADPAGVNGETVAEEEEKNILTDAQESFRTQDADASEGEQTNGEESGETRARKGNEEVAKELENPKAPNEAGEEDLSEEIKEEMREKQEFDIERKNAQNKVTGRHLSDDERAGVGWEDRVKPREVDLREENPYRKGSEVTDAESGSMTLEDGQSDERCSRATSDMTHNEVGDASTASVHSVQDETVVDKENQHISSETPPGKESESPRPKAVGVEEEAFTGAPETDQSGHESASAESDSDDEVELYMHCLRAVHAGARAERNKDKSRPPASRGRLPPMPSISECQDEEQHRGVLRDGQAAAAAPASRGPDATGTKLSRWKETFSCSEVSKLLLLASLLVVFLVVAYRYDFLACLGLYLLSVVWLYCHEEKRPKQQNEKQKGLN